MPGQISSLSLFNRVPMAKALDHELTRTENISNLGKSISLWRISKNLFTKSHEPLESLRSLCRQSPSRSKLVSHPIISPRVIVSFSYYRWGYST